MKVAQPPLAPVPERKPDVSPALTDGTAGEPSFRDTLVQLGEQRCTTPEEFKAWSQNLGHERVMTTLTSYGNVAPHRQAGLIRGLGEARPVAVVDPSSRLISWQAAFAAE